MEREDADHMNFNCCSQNNPQWIDRETKRFRNQRTSWDYRIIKIGQNTEKSSGDLRRLAVTQTPVQNYHLTLVWKTLKRVKKKKLKQLTSDISPMKTSTWLRRRKHKVETASLLIAAQNNSIRTNHIESRIDKMKQKMLM